MKKPDTQTEFSEVKSRCRKVFEDKMSDYGTSWRVMRPSSLTDQIYIKARRIRSIEEKNVKCVDEGIEPEFIGMVNYCVMALIQLDLGSGPNLEPDTALELYNKYLDKATELMKNKNHDYDEAWREMRISSFTDIILQKLRRTKEIEDHQGQTKVSEGIDANYIDIIVYSIFALIKIEEQREGK